MRVTRQALAFTATALLAVAAIIMATPLAARPQDKMPARQQWASPREYIAGTERSRLKSARSIGAGRGAWIIAYLGIGCRDCDAVVPALNTLAASNRVIGVAIASQGEIEQWRSYHQARFPVRAVSEQTFEDFGAVVLPTIVRFENGKATGARAPSMEGESR